MSGNNSQTVNVQIRVRKGLKNEAEKVLKQFDMSLSEAIRLFLNDIYRNKRIPVDLTLNLPNISSMREKIKKSSNFPDMNEEEYQDWWNKNFK